MGALDMNPDQQNQADQASERISGLISAAVGGDRRAFEELYRGHVNRVYGLCLRLTRDQDRAEILTQDTFVRAWYALGGFKNDGHFSAWLARIATNLWRDQYRSRARQQKMLQDLATEGLGPEATAAQAHEGKDSAWLPRTKSGWSVLTAIELERALAQLPSGARTVFVLHDIEGYKHREIAEMLDVTTGTVKAQLHRARRLLRLRLTRESEANGGS